MSFVKPAIFGFLLITATGQCLANGQGPSTEAAEEKAPLISEKYLLKKPAGESRSEVAQPQDTAEATQPTQVNGAVVDATQPTEVNGAVIDVVEDVDALAASVTEAAEEAAEAVEAAAANAESGAEAKPVDLDLASIDPDASGRVNVVRERLNWSHATTDMGDRVEYLEQLKAALVLRNEIRKLGRGQDLVDMEKLAVQGQGFFSQPFPTNDPVMPEATPEPQPSYDPAFSPQDQLGLSVAVPQPSYSGGSVRVAEVYGDYVVLSEGGKEAKVRVGGTYKGKRLTITNDGVVMLGGKAL